MNNAITPEELAAVLGNTGLTVNEPTPAASVAAVVPPVPAPIAAPMATMPAPTTAHPAQFAPLKPTAAAPATNLDMLLGVTLKVVVELGRTKMTIEEILKLGPGSVVELDKIAGEPVDVFVNDRLVARGEVVVIDDRFGVRVTDVLPPAQRITPFQ